MQLPKTDKKKYSFNKEHKVVENPKLVFTIVTF